MPPFIHACMAGRGLSPEPSLQTSQKSLSYLSNVTVSMLTCLGEKLHKVSPPQKRWNIHSSFAKSEARINLSNPDKRARALTFKQTKKSLAFMPEYSTVATARFTNYTPTFKAGDKLKTQILDDENNVLPSAARILRVTLKHPKGGRVKFESEKSDECFYEVACGKPWGEEEFITEAHRRGHPAHLFQSLSSSMIQAIDANVNLKPSEVISHRAKWLKKWMTRAVALKSQEEELHAKMPRERKLILAKKKILPLREILKDEGYPDITHDLTQGFPLVGLCGESDALPPDFQPATMSVPDLEPNPSLHKGQWRCLGGR